MFNFLDKLLSKLPFDGAKTVLGLVLSKYAEQIPLPEIQAVLHAAGALYTAAGALHKVAKAKLGK